ncbi:hypothetical protein M413DRAFT_449766 [Hebeloma cylindrosporum]|uniref:Uncharacterized protein n=1 Tax=Hebeloma cylindrosporum TaxID=76867 RepID=A0A0C3BTF4_HEBCY|nr:hypothetical protein M413DRAFT_449766 [Hebeloma cylindrosporum h7]
MFESIQINVNTNVNTYNFHGKYSTVWTEASSGSSSRMVHSRASYTITLNIKGQEIARRFRAERFRSFAPHD